jgi:hypothetical protein
MAGSTRYMVAGGRRSTLRAAMLTMFIAAIAAIAPAIAGAAGSGYQWKGQAFMPVAKAYVATWEGKMIATDSETFKEGEKFAKMSVECNDKFEGYVNTGGAGEITKLVSSECKGLGSTTFECSKTATTGTTITASDLPWRTEVVKSELGPPIQRMLEDGKGTPKLNIECRIGIGVKDTCTGNLAVNVTKMAPTAGAFDNKERLTCSLRGNPSGYVEGSQTLAYVSGLEEGTPVWNVTGEKTINWSKGSLTVVDQPNGPYGAPWGITCEDAGEGTVSTGGAGTITKETLSKCAQSIDSECNGADSIEALHLPWKTQLYSGSLESFSDLIAEGGGGAVAFNVKCESHGVKGEDTCEAPTGTSGRLAAFMANVEGGVSAKYYGPSAGLGLYCHRGGPEQSEFSESSHTLKLSGGGTLTVSG